MDANPGGSVEKPRATIVVATALFVIAVELLGPGAADAASVERSASDTGVSAQDPDPQPELPPGAGRIIGSPDAGPDPEHSGDRGGWAQLVLLGALAVGVGFITWRIVTGVRVRSVD